MGNSHATISAGQSTASAVTVEDIGAHILNADPKLKDVPWSQKQLYSRRALENAKKQHLEGGTNRVIDPFWDKLAIQQPSEPTAPSVVRKRSQLFLDSINQPKVQQPTRSELGMSSPSSSISGGQCDDTSEEEEDDDE